MERGLFQKRSIQHDKILCPSESKSLFLNGSYVSKISMETVIRNGSSLKLVQLPLMKAPLFPDKT